MLKKGRRGRTSLKTSGFCVTKRLMSMTSGSASVREKTGGFIEGRIYENIENSYYRHFDAVMLWVCSHQGKPTRNRGQGGYLPQRQENYLC